MFFCIRSMRKRVKVLDKREGTKGQATIEAAALIPVLFILLLLLLQPSILLFDRIVMKNVAAEGCRLLATKTPVLSEGKDPYEEYVLTRLSSIPEEDHFHVHSQGCSWKVSLTGDETSNRVGVQIVNKVKPLPLVDFMSRSIGLTDSDGFFEIKVEAEFSPKMIGCLQMWQETILLIGLSSGSKDEKKNEISRIYRFLLG